MRRYNLGAHTKTDLKVHLEWVPKYRKRILTGQVAIRLRDVLRQMEFPHLKKIFWGMHFWGRGYLAVSLGNITDEMIQSYIDEQKGEPLQDDSRFEIDSSLPKAAVQYQRMNV